MAAFCMPLVRLGTLAAMMEKRVGAWNQKPYVATGFPEIEPKAGIGTIPKPMLTVVVSLLNASATTRRQRDCVVPAGYVCTGFCSVLSTMPSFSKSHAHESGFPTDVSVKTAIVVPGVSEVEKTAPTASTLMCPVTDCVPNKALVTV